MTNIKATTVMAIPVKACRITGFGDPIVATSRGSAIRPIGVRATIAASASGRDNTGSTSGVRDLVQNQHWQVGLGADVAFYSKPAALDPVYGDSPVSFHVFLRVRPGLSHHGP